jgi:GntR family transcriptional regulator of arabinose operon
MSQNNVAKYVRIIEDIKNDILAGKIQPGDRISSENQLCAQYQVSRHTVRKAIADLTNQGYLSSIHGKGTFCCKHKSYKTASRNIAVITTYISDYIFPHVIRGIDEVLSKQGYSIILKSTGNSQSMEGKCLEDILSKNIDGLIIEPSKSEILNRNIGLYEKLQEYRIPYVFIHGIYRQLEDQPCILLADRKGAYMATKHLIEQGRKKLIGIFKIDDYQGKERYKGYIEALQEAGISFDPDRSILFHTEDRKRKPALMTREFLERGMPIDGIVCYNDQVAYSIYHELQALQIKVPEEIAMIGFDNSFLAENNRVPFSSIEHPKEELGKMAAGLLLDLIHGRVQKDQLRRVIDPELVLRESTQKLP